MENKEQTRCFNFPSIAVGSSSWSDSNGDLARSAFHGNGESSRTRVSSHLARLASGAVPHYRRTDLQHSEATQLNLSSSHSQPSLSAGCNHGGHRLELPGGLVGSLPHLGRLPCHLRLRHRPQGPAEELGGGLDEDEVEVEQHVRGAQLLPGSKASQSQPSHGAAAVSPKWVQPSRIPTSLH